MPTRCSKFPEVTPMKPQQMFAFVLVSCLSVCSALVGAGAEPLPAKVTELMEQPRFKHAHWGLLVVDLKSGEPIYELNPEKLFAPASVTKCFSVASALDAFGADYRFQTPIVRRGEVNDKGELQGDLILIASGDLTMGGRTTESDGIAFA